MLQYYNEKNNLGYINQQEKKFLNQGVLFKVLKLYIFQMRPDELEEKELFFKNGKFDMI